LILNQFLPPDVLQKTLSKETFQDLDFILDVLDENKKIPIFKNNELLGNIHHAVNLDRYSKKSFRKSLLSSAPDQIKNKYFKKCKIKKNVSNMTKQELMNNISKVVNFDWGNNEATKQFVTFFNYPEYIIPKNLIKNQVKEIVYGGSKTKNNFKPLDMILDYQSKIVFKTLKELEFPNVRLLIQMPTGTGKTRTAMEILAHIMNRKKGQQIVWLTDSSELLTQAADAFIKNWTHVGKYPIELYRIWGSGEIPKIKKENSIIFAGYDKLNNLLKKSKTILSPDLVILDEAHRILARTYKHALDSIRASGDDVQVIGLTATPGRGLDEEQNNLLVETFRNRIISIELDNPKDVEMYEDNIVEYLEDNGVLSKAILEPIETELEYDVSEEEWIKLSALYVDENNEYTADFLKKMANDNRRNILIIEKLKEYAENGKKVLYFSVNLEQSVLIFAALLRLGINVVHISGKTDKEFRSQVIEKFKDSDEIQVICNYNIFSTGFDVPELDVVFIGRPINSPVLFNQIVGRGTRGKVMGGEETFRLVQVIDKITAGDKKFNPYRHYSFWDKNWESNN
jgi:DNA repair protein RadD